MCLTGPFWSLAAYQLDAAVITFGIMIENASQETVEVGSGTSKRIRQRWKLAELLADDFKFPRDDDGLAAFRNVDGYEEV